MGRADSAWQPLGLSCLQSGSLDALRLTEMAAGPCAGAATAAARSPGNRPRRLLHPGDLLVVNGARRACAVGQRPGGGRASCCSSNPSRKIVAGRRGKPAKRSRRTLSTTAVTSS